MNVSSLSLQSAKAARQVIACVDRSAHARNVADAAAGLARALDLPLVLYHVIEPAGGAGHRPDPLEWNLRRQQARNHLEQLRAALPREGEPAVLEVAEGERVVAISERGTAPGSILVIGANAEGEGLSFHRRTAQQVLEAGVGPVLLVPRGHAASGLSFNRILVPLDGSHFADAALAEASMLARKTQAELLLAHVVPDAGLMAYGPPETTDMELRARLDKRNQGAASDFLDKTSRRMSQQGFKVRSLCLKGETRSTLQRAIAQERPSIVILSARGQSGQSCPDLPIGSTASYLLDHLAGPTMFLPATPARSQRPLIPAPDYRMSPSIRVA